MIHEDIRESGADPWEALRIAIVQQAAEDYRQALRWEKHGYYSKYTDLRPDTIKRFFVSDYGEALCLGMGAWIARRIEHEIEEENNEKRIK